MIPFLMKKSSEQNNRCPNRKAIEQVKVLPSFVQSLLFLFCCIFGMRICVRMQEIDQGLQFIRQINILDQYI